jgi:hypothetical protein
MKTQATARTATCVPDRRKAWRRSSRFTRSPVRSATKRRDALHQADTRVPPDMWINSRMSVT